MLKRKLIIDYVSSKEQNNNNTGITEYAINLYCCHEYIWLVLSQHFVVTVSFPRFTVESVKWSLPKALGHILKKNCYYWSCKLSLIKYVLDINQKSVLVLRCSCFFKLMLMVVGCLEVFCTCSINIVFFEKRSYFGPMQVTV